MAGNVYSYNIGQTLLWKVRNFPDDVYNFDPADHATTLMNTLLGNAGTGQLDLVQIAARLSQEYLEFSDLDNILGTILSTPRLPSEIYNTNNNPFTDQITQSNWNDIFSKDASYRERLDGIAASLTRGATPFGLQMAAEAASSTRFKVLEPWKLTLSGNTISGTNIPTRGFGANEIILYPQLLPNIPFGNSERSGVLTVARKLKTVGSIITLASGVTYYTQAPYIITSGTVASGTAVYTTSGTYSIISGTGEYFYFNRQVLGNGLNPPSYVTNSTNTAITSRYWLSNDSTTSAPYFAHLQTQESVIDVTRNISTVNITPISSAGQPPVYSTTAMLNNLPLKVTSTVYGAL